MNKHFVLCALSCAFLLFSNPLYALKVVFRYDDPTLRQDSVHLRVFELFCSKQVPLSVAVVASDEQENAYIPNDSTYLALLNNPNIEVMIHGLNHSQHDGIGEFGSIDNTESLRRLSKAKQILSTYIDKPIRTFVPPFNAISPSLPQAMVQNDMLILSDHIFNHVYAKDIQYYPETLGHLMKQEGIWNAAERAIFGCKVNDAVCVIMFHSYDLPDEQTWLQVERLLDRCNNDSSIELYTFQNLNQSGEKSDYHRYRANQLESGLQKHLLPIGVLYPTYLCYLVHCLNALLYSLIPLLFLLLTLAICHRNKRNRQLAAILYSLAAITTFLLAWYHALGPLKLLALSVIISCGIALIVILMYRMHKATSIKP